MMNFVKVEIKTFKFLRMKSLVLKILALELYQIFNTKNENFKIFEKFKFL